MYMYDCKCCGEVFNGQNQSEEIVCPNCGAPYDEDETYIERYQE